MKKLAMILVVLLACISISVARSYSPRDLNAKVAEADLIIMGTATAVGEKIPSQIYDYERNLQIDIDEILWPPMTGKVEKVILKHGVREAWPRTWWDYNHTRGIFFLVKTRRGLDFSSPDDVRVSISTVSNTVPVSPSAEEDLSQPMNFIRLSRFNDWFEPSTNSNAVRDVIRSGCILSPQLTRIYEVAIVDGAGVIKYDGLVVGFGTQENAFVIDCYRDGAWEDNLMLDAPHVHGAQPSMVIPSLSLGNENRILPVRGTPYCVVIDLKDVVSKDDRFIAGKVGIQMVKCTQASHLGETELQSQGIKP